MSEYEKLVELTPEMKDYITEMVTKSLQIMEQTKGHQNVTVSVGGMSLPVRVDDLPLFYIGCYLLPNIMNYLINILPQFIYPYCVAYLQDLGAMREDPVTINELFDYLINYNHGNILDSSETEG